MFCINCNKDFPSVKKAYPIELMWDTGKKTVLFKEPCIMCPHCGARYLPEGYKMLPSEVFEREREEEDPKQRFFGVYPNLPLNERGNVCAVVNADEPVSWKIAKLEIEHDTKIGEEILAQLVRMDLI